jgi:hypothetical protein
MMSPINSPFYFEILKGKVLEVAGLKHISAADCKALSVLCFRKTHRYLSETTIKRIYGFAQTGFAPSAFTKNVLAVFCGYNGWHDFTLEHLAGKRVETEERQVGKMGGSEILKPFLDAMMINIFLLSAVYGDDGTIKDFRIELANQEMEEATGRKDLHGKLYSTEYPGTKKAGLFELMVRVMETGQPERIEYYYPYDGLQAWYASLLVKTTEGLWTAHYELSKTAEYRSVNPRRQAVLS